MAWRSVNTVGWAARKSFDKSRERCRDWGSDKRTGCGNESSLFVGMIRVVMIAGAAAAIGKLEVVVRMSVLRVSALINNLTCGHRMKPGLVCSRRCKCKQQNADHRQKGGEKIGKSAFLSQQHRGHEYAGSEIRARFRVEISYRGG